MPRIMVRPMVAADVRAAAALLAARHRQDRERLPMLAASLEQPAACEALLAPALASARASGFVAEAGGRTIGFVIGERNLFGPDHFAYQFIPPHSGSIGAEGHAVEATADAVETYRALYRALADEWVAAGFFTHRWYLTAGDPVVTDAVVGLGFGRHSWAATRPVAEPVEAHAHAAVEVHRAGAEDIDIVVELSNQLMAFHSRSPMFWPFLRTTDDSARAFNLAELASGETPYFVAYLDGRPAGMQTFLRPGFTPAIVEQDGNVYLFDGIVDESLRSAGVGAALLRHSMRWAAEAGLRTCTLHFSSQNYSGGPFWLGHGFVPVEATMERHIDERIAWAHG